MNKQKQIEAMAVLDGFKAGDSITYPQYFYKDDRIYAKKGQGGEPTLPDYLHDHNAIFRVLKAVETNPEFVMNFSCSLYADAGEWVEAILKACGKWQPEQKSAEAGRSEG